MIFLIARIITRLFSIDMQKAQKIAIWMLIGLVALIVLVTILWFRSCFSKSVKLDEKEIQEVQNAIEDRNDTKLREKLADIQVREQINAGTVANSAANTAAATQKAKEDAANMNTDQLAAELEKYK